MKIRNYNIYFSTHTISGIIICAILYVIFFAGSFSFFKDEISAWQTNNSYANNPVDYTEYDKLLDSLQTGFDLNGRDIQFYLQKSEAYAYINITSSKDTILNKENLEKNDSKYFNYDFVTKKSGDYQSTYDMGEFLYRLHFLAQLNQVPINLGIAPFGYLIAGITSFLFLFALITGLLLHWDKIVSNFFIFRPFNKWKTVWTDMHTALGVIGFPFQFIFAVTGIFLILNTVLALPFEKILYQENAEKMYQDLGFAHATSSEYSYKSLKNKVSIAPILTDAKKKWPHSEFKRISILNYGDQNMQFILESDPHYEKNFSGSGLLVIQAKDHKIIAEKSPNSNPTYVDQVRGILYRLHFGDFGGYPLKIIYFILGIMGCLVITSGILIWLVARNKNNVIPRKRKFNFWLANTYLAICLSMFPVTAFTFIAIKISSVVNQAFIYKIYFWSWLILVIYFIIRQNLNRTNRESLFIGSLLSLAVPIVNGIMTQNWIYKSLVMGETDIFIIDFLWLCLSIIGFIVYFKTKRYFNAKSA